MKRVLITGITGQDGTYLARWLLEKNCEIFGITRDEFQANHDHFFYLGIDNDIKLLGVNLLDLSNIIRILDKYQPDEIYNLAAQSSVGVSFEQPIGTLEFNIISTANLLEAIRLVNSKTRFYQASSSEMFGNVERDVLPINERFVFHPVSPYAISKASAHWITVNYRETYGLFAVCGILFNHESVLRSKNFVIKKIVNTAVKISMGLADHIELGNLSIWRDWGYAPEYIKAMWLMLQQEKPRDYIICSGKAHSLESLVRLTFEKLNLDFARCVRINRKYYRPMELDIIYGDNEQAKNVLGWQYSMSLEELMSQLIKDEISYIKWNGQHKL